MFAWNDGYLKLGKKINFIYENRVLFSTFSFLLMFFQLLWLDDLVFMFILLVLKFDWLTKQNKYNLPKLMYLTWRKNKRKRKKVHQRFNFSFFFFYKYVYCFFYFLNSLTKLSRKIFCFSMIHSFTSCRKKPIVDIAV